MRTVTAFDNINRLGAATYFDRFFGEMEITETQKQRRIKIAEDIEEDVLMLFMLYILALEYGREIDRARAEKEYRDNLRISLARHDIRPEVVESYLDDVADEVVRVTANRYKEDGYWTSDDRAKTIAGDDANAIMFAQEYREAKENGKTGKQWITMRDERVRLTHRDADGEAVPIDEPFVVGNSLLMFPHDTSLGADLDEICGCRCSVSYI